MNKNIVNKLVLSFLSICLGSVFTADETSTAYSITGTDFRPDDRFDCLSGECLGAVDGVPIYRIKSTMPSRTFFTYDTKENKGNLEDALHIERLTTPEEEAYGIERFLLCVALANQSAGNKSFTSPDIGSKSPAIHKTESILITHEVSFSNCTGTPSMQVKQVFFESAPISVKRSFFYDKLTDSVSSNTRALFRTKTDSLLTLDDLEYDQLAKLSLFWQCIPEATKLFDPQEGSGEVVEFVMDVQKINNSFKVSCTRRSGRFTGVERFESTRQKDLVSMERFQ